ncbi:FAD-dependent monooxygenase [Actinophytocola sp.]|uniref:FAD-dependent monooxygenase n=1 Tax=Actinophytocola sp. TaxID=1872138 RepID=UPI002D322937|nr:FAD-dependent monooxygenase [Actinophytocola sp.]HYQ63100.1 FAD-dependent monooxygenase [Actinophytocola sp.]
MNDVFSGEVLVVGGGPVGLWLAGELGLAGVRTVLVERLAERSPHSKALGIHARTLEVFAARGVVDEFLDNGIKVPAWHFGMLPQKPDYTGLATPYPFILAFPQSRTEEILERRAVALGARILRGREVTALHDDDESLTAELADGSRITARYVVGADGAGSTVRRLAGIGFPGVDGTAFGFLGDVVLDAPPPPGLTLHNEHGALVVAPVPGGFFRLTGYDAADQEPGRRTVTLEELRASVTRIAGTDFGLRDPNWLSRFSSATRHAETYRKGRVFLAGDAAHMHFPAGGVGLNVGVQDAMNLGWKLAAVLRGRTAPGLLDTYHDERHPVGVDLVEHTLAQTALLTAVSPEGRALRDLFGKLISTQPAMARELAEKLSGIAVRYPPPDPDAHPLTGTRVADTRQLLVSGRAVLLAPGAQELKDDAAALGIDVVDDTPDDTLDLPGITAALLRPDGHLWWATETPDPLPASRHALQTLTTPQNRESRTRT